MRNCPTLFAIPFVFTLHHCNIIRNASTSLRSHLYSHCIFAISFVLRVHLCNPIRITHLPSRSWFHLCDSVTLYLYKIPFVLHLYKPIRTAFLQSHLYYIFAIPFALDICNLIRTTSCSCVKSAWSRTCFLDPISTVQVLHKMSCRQVRI